MKISNDRVTLSYKDHSHDNQIKEMTLSGVEFIRRFLLHVLPFCFMKIRYYGFLANICKKKSVLLIRRLVGKDMSTPGKVQETIRENLLRLTGRDIGLCPECKIGEMLLQKILEPLYDSGCNNQSTHGIIHTDFISLIISKACHATDIIIAVCFTGVIGVEGLC